MTNDPVHGEAAGRYAAAHMAHYATQDLRRALKLYQNIVASHPDTPEAGWSQTQILNIVNSVVPAREFLADQVQLALAHLEQDRPVLTVQERAELHAKRAELDEAWDMEAQERLASERQRRKKARRRGR